MKTYIRISISIFLGVTLMVGAFVALTQAPDATLASSTQANSSKYLLKQIGGFADTIVKKGNYVYLGIGSRIDIVDVQDEANPVTIGQTDRFTKELHSLYLLGNYGIAPVSYGLYIFDFSQPLAPTLAQTHPLPSEQINDFVMSGTVAFISEQRLYSTLSGSGGLRILDVSDPLNPIQLSNPLEGNSVYSVAVKDNYAYIGYCESIDETGCISRFAVWDISDLSAPFEINKTSASDTDDQEVYDQYLYRLDDSGELKIYDIGMPTSPVFLTSIFPDSSAIEIHDNWLVGLNSPGLKVYDLSSNPGNPTLFGDYWLSHYFGPFDAAIDGNRAYMAYGADGLHIADLSQSSLPKIGQHKMVGSVSDLAQVNNYVYLLDYYYDLHVLDVTSPATPVKLTKYDHGSFSNHLAIDGSDAFIYGSYNVQIIDIAEPLTPSLRSTYASPEGSIGEIIPDGNVAYALNDGGDVKTFEVVDISDRNNPVFVTSVGQNCMSGEDLLITGNYAFVSESNGCGGSSALTVIDISTPNNPQIVASQPVSYKAGPLAYINDHIYMGDYRVRVFDVTNPAIPQPMGQFTVTGAVDFDYSVKAVDGQLYVAAFDDKDNVIKLILDVSNPVAPIEIGSFEYVEKLVLTDNLFSYSYAPAGSNGLFIYATQLGEERIYLPLVTNQE
ncbi:MAG: hypothetical protein GY805_27805 [Chloroflexi bacterium]|nr:hypothetical protein [Chloroflexota bacterium]